MSLRSLEVEPRRVLVVDDNEAIHRDFEKILTDDDRSDLDKLRAEVFEDSSVPARNERAYNMDFALQGEEGCEKVRIALAEGRPYSLAFVDMRMPPGWDGMETIKKLWELDEDLQVVVCTAYSDYSWQRLNHQAKRSDRLLILKKPFDVVEVKQLAAALVRKWELAREAQLKMDELETMVADRTEALAAANAHKNSFLAAMSHEFKTPLNGILGYVDLLQGEHFGTLNEKQNEFVARIDHCGKHLLSLVVQLLAVVRHDVEATELELSSFSVADLVSSAVRIVEAQSLKKVRDLTSHLDPQIDLLVADLSKCRQILTILLSNAIKFTPEDGAIKIQVEKGVKDTLKFIVTDTGSGIPLTEQRRIFAEFHQTPGARDAHIGGVGIGLSLATRLVHLHKGDIGVESEPGVGSAFWFSLPQDQ